MEDHELIWEWDMIEKSLCEAEGFNLVDMFKPINYSFSGIETLEKEI